MIELLPNLGAEEGDDWRGLASQPAVRVAARLWALVHPRETRLHDRPVGGAAGPTAGEPIDRDALWPEALGPPAEGAACAGVPERGGAIAWLNTPTIADFARAELGAALEGPAPEVVAPLHDKAFAVEVSETLGLTPRPLQSLVEPIEPEALGDVVALANRLDARLRDWPAWTGRRFTLKPRHGSSGRGRFGGHDTIDRSRLAGALPRLAARGGAIFEPWLEREADFSVIVDVPASSQTEALPVLVGSLEMLASESGVYRGHCGELDHRGRVFSGDPDDEALRADAAGVAGVARTRGYFGPCGVDAFRYREPAQGDAGDRSRLRGAVEFNARPTMGLVAIGLVRRALSTVRTPLALQPGDRRAFALIQLDRRRDQTVAALREALPDDALWLDLTPPASAIEGFGPEDAALCPTLLFARERAPLRMALRRVLGC